MHICGVGFTESMPFVKDHAEYRSELSSEAKDRNAIHEGLAAYNDEHCSLNTIRRKKGNDPYPMTIVVRSVGGAIVGGIIGQIWETFGWLHIASLWVDDDHRGKGLGTQLVKQMEQVAKSRGCTRAKVNTWSFQAPGFYQRLGYEVCGTIPDFPEGIDDITLWRRLS